MKSPFTGGNVVLHSEKRTAVFRKEKIEYTFLSYQCVDTCELFTTTELDTAKYNHGPHQFSLDYRLELRNAANCDEQDTYTFKDGDKRATYDYSGIPQR